MHRNFSTNVSEMKKSIAALLSSGKIGRAVRNHDERVRRQEAKTTSLYASHLWKAGQLARSTEVLRASLSNSSAEASAHFTYAQRLLEQDRADAAFEALKNCLDRDPSHLNALEFLIEIARVRFPKQGYESRYLQRMLDSVVQVPNRHRESLDYLIPFQRGERLTALASSPDAVTRAVVSLHHSDLAPPADELDPQDRALATAIYFLGRGRSRAAVALLDAMDTRLLPATSIRRAARRALAKDDRRAAHLLLEQYLRSAPKDRWARIQYKTTGVASLSDRELATSGYPLPPPSETLAYEPKKGKILYVVYNSLPYHSAGYATRTHGLLSALVAQGTEVAALSRLGYPFDMKGYSQTEEIEPLDLIEGIEYHRAYSEHTVVPRRPLQAFISRYADVIEQHARKLKPERIHAASNYVNGLAAAIAARRLGLPFTYELRGLWEITRVSREPEWEANLEYGLMVRMETDAANAADSVIAITAALRDELIRRGTSASKIALVPNGVDADKFRPDVADKYTLERLGLGGKTVIGYVGSLLDYEGLDLLLKAARTLHLKRNDFCLLIVGDGPARQQLEDLAHTLGLSHIVTFTGRVPHDEVAKYYSVIDIAPFPRLPLPVCEMVSPIKPFEAMAMEKTIVVSSVAALAEIVDDGVTGRVHEKGDYESLATVLQELLNDPASRYRMNSRARKWVLTERAWSSLAAATIRAYDVSEAE